MNFATCRANRPSQRFSLSSVSLADLDVHCCLDILLACAINIAVTRSDVDTPCFRFAAFDLLG